MALVFPSPRCYFTIAAGWMSGRLMDHGMRQTHLDASETHQSRWEQEQEHQSRHISAQSPRLPGVVTVLTTFAVVAISVTPLRSSKAHSP
ncbi:hypothetical protein E4U54_003305 [Claviceps lovelessii]|nr:hypothetical protein E4U54_003305 [Claviceps lovelessii]